VLESCDFFIKLLIQKIHGIPSQALTSTKDHGSHCIPEADLHQPLSEC